MISTQFCPAAWVRSRYSFSASTWSLTVAAPGPSCAAAMWNSAQMVRSSSSTVSLGLKM